MNKFLVIGIILILLAVGGYIALSSIYKGYFLNNPSNCESLQTGKDACYNSIAQKNRNPNLCDKISIQSSDPKSDSRDNCYSNVAESLLNSDLCTKILKISGDGSRDTCYLNIATKTKNVDLCDKMASQSTTVINGGQVFVNKDFCVQNVAMEALNSTLCDSISVKIHKPTTPLNVSVQSCYAFVGQNSKNPSLCDKAGTLKDPCLEGAKQQK